MTRQTVYVAIGVKADGEVMRYSSSNMSGAASAYHAYKGTPAVFVSAELCEVTITRDEQTRVLESFTRGAFDEASTR